MNQQMKYEVHQVECPGCGRLVTRRLPVSEGANFNWSRHSCHFCGSNLGVPSGAVATRDAQPAAVPSGASGPLTHPLQAPAYLGKGPGPYQPPTESWLGPFWDRLISWTAVGLGALGLLIAMSAYSDGNFHLWWTLASAGYVIGGLLNAYLTYLWRCAEPGSGTRIAIVLAKPLVILCLLVAVFVGLLILVLWALLLPWAIKEKES